MAEKYPLSDRLLESAARLAVLRRGRSQYSVPVASARRIHSSGRKFSTTAKCFRRKFGRFVIGCTEIRGR